MLNILVDVVYRRKPSSLSIVILKLELVKKTAKAVTTDQSFILDRPLVTELVVSERTIAQLSKIADDKGTTTQQLAEQAIRQFLRDEVRRVLQRESDAFRAMHTELLEKYPNQFLAIHQERVVDKDKDQLSFYLRVDEKYPDTPVLIKQVLPESEEVYVFRSPRICEKV